MTYKIGLLIDEKRYEAIKNLPISERLKSMFGGEIKILELDVDDDVAKRILAEFPAARVDSRGFLEDLPVAFKRALFDAVVKTGSVGREAFDEVFRHIEEIREAAKREKEYIPPP
ncbi:DUF6955 family protein [Thermoproteus tenax]|uniref:Uncharacterized protein n=1 Tax=Thermoproteus tenax (strain ATCC 35583 / DSM 2078 / JCM 9277 / NBRC 100435 / Kra 1) TaxID=768679 RepID=G4RNG6_THETK|nr:hypothetical protein [Thermoproteus tenax]CCC81110.1 hypothetical protein TTX_0442 [Thermoproteus tenax Kra 1]